MEVIEIDGFQTIGLMATMKEHELFIKMPKLYEKLDSFTEFQKKILYEICLEKKANKYTEFVGILKEEEISLIDGLVELTLPKAQYLYHQYIGNSQGIYQAYVEMVDYALNNNLSLDENEFKIEINKDGIYDLHIRLKH